MSVHYEPLSNIDIKYVMKGDNPSNRIFSGVFPADMLPIRTKVPCALIVNTDKRNKAGAHWVSIYINQRRQGEFFDSYGLPPLVKEHKQFLARVCKSWVYNKTPLQGVTSSVCGHYCCLFVAAKARAFSLQSFIKSLQTNDPFSNDAKVILAFKRYFPLNLKGRGQKSNKKYCNMICCAKCKCKK